MGKQRSNVKRVGSQDGKKFNLPNSATMVNEKVENDYVFHVRHCYCKFDREANKALSDELQSESLMGVKSISYMRGSDSVGGFVEMSLLNDTPNINSQCLLQAFKSNIILASLFNASIEDLKAAQERGRKFAVKVEEKDHGRGNVVLYEIKTNRFGSEELDRLGHLYITSSGSIGNFAFKRICLAILLNEAAKIKPGPCPLDVSSVYVEEATPSTINLEEEGLQVLGSIGDLLQ